MPRPGLSAAAARVVAREAGADRGSVGKLPTHADVLRGVVDSLEGPAVRRMDRQIGGIVERLHARLHRERAVAAEGRVDEIFREPLRLRLRADENGDAENDPAKAEEERALPVPDKTERDVERRCHFPVAD